MFYSGPCVLFPALHVSIYLLCVWALLLQVSAAILHIALQHWAKIGEFYSVWWNKSGLKISWVSHRAVCKKFGLHVGRLLLAFLVLSAGMFCSSAGRSDQTGHLWLICLITWNLDYSCNCLLLFFFFFDTLCIHCRLMCVFVLFAAFLPSTFCMYSTVVAMTGWFQGRPSLAVLGIAAGAIVGWPFCALLG